MTNLEITCQALAELFWDKEFGLSLDVRPPGSMNAPRVLRYLTERGVPENDARLLVMAYLAGCTHTFEATDRTLLRLQALTMVKSA